MLFLEGNKKFFPDGKIEYTRFEFSKDIDGRTFITAI